MRALLNVEGAATTPTVLRGLTSLLMNRDNVRRPSRPSRLELSGELGDDVEAPSPGGCLECLRQCVLYVVRRDSRTWQRASGCVVIGNVVLHAVCRIALIGARRGIIAGILIPLTKVRILPSEPRHPAQSDPTLQRASLLARVCGLVQCSRGRVRGKPRAP